MVHRALVKPAGLLASLLGAVVLIGALPVQAASVQLDSGKPLDRAKPYEKSVAISDPYTTQAIYGKLEGDIPIDIYKLTADKDGKQTVSLRVPLNGKGTEDLRPILIMMDPTDATESQPIDLPLPSDKHHATLIKEVNEPVKEDGTRDLRTSTEPFLMQKFHIVAEQEVKLQKGQTYYLLVLDPNRVTKTYALQLGDGLVWGAKDIVTRFPAWVRLQTNVFAGTSPFKFSSLTGSMIVYLLGLALLVGILVIQEFLALYSRRSKPAGYLLVKLQSFSRVIIWISLWFMLLGGVYYFTQTGWIGIPFVLAALFIPLVISMLWMTLSLAPRISQLEVTKREAVIPADLQKRLYVFLALAVVTVIPTLVLSAMVLGR